MKVERKRDCAILAWRVTSERFAGSLCNGSHEIPSAVLEAFKGGPVNQLITTAFTHTVGGQAEQLHLGFYEFGARLVAFLWLGPNYRKNRALWAEGVAWEKHLNQLLGEGAAETRLMDPVFWLQKQGAGVEHVQVNCK